MAKYLLSTHTIEGESQGPMSDEEMQGMMKRTGELDEEMKSAAALVAWGCLHGPETATVVTVSDGEALTTDGPFAEAKEHLGGFYILEAADLDGALEWGKKTSASIGRPIEVRPFAGFHGA